MTRTVYRFRLATLCLGLVALVFVQEPGRVAADSKLDLTVDPVGFMARALHMWDDSGFFGQVQNQAYGYLWPVGPFFGVLREAGLAAWSVQRLWWAIVLVVGLLGFVRLARLLGVDSAPARVLGGLGYIFSVRMVSELSTVSVEAWPMALAPWILIPLVLGSRSGSARRWAALSGLAFLMTGAINAVASVAVLGLGAVFLATRQRGRRAATLTAWWLLSIALASLWWVIPLLLLGRYSPPFLDWIESASTTTSQNDPTTVLRGATQWIPYVVEAGGPAWPAGWTLVTNGAVILATGLLVLLAVAGLLPVTVPERSFLVLTLCLGLVLTGAAHLGVSGVGALGAPVVRDLLDGALAPLRNVHKFQPLVTLPLMVGLAHAVAALQRGARAHPTTWARPRAAVLVVTVLALVAASAAPVFLGRLVGGRSYSEIPDYWAEATQWLNERATGRSLVIPASSFGVYVWGRTNDEPLQALGAQSWGVRDAVPLGSAGNTRLLDEIERHLDTGTASDGLASTLARSGVRWLVLRNDLNARATDAPLSLLVHQALDGSRGIERVATFGPVLDAFDSGGTVVDAGLRRPFPAVEVFSVAPDRATSGGRVALRDASEVVRFSGSTEALVGLGASGLVGDAPAIAVGDPVPAGSRVRSVLTDSYRRSEANFGSVRDQYSETLTADSDLRSERRVHDYYPVEPEGRRSEALLDGAAGVSASSSGSSPFALRGRSQAAQPWAALDGDPSTSWISGQLAPGVGQWWEVELERPMSLSAIDVRFERDYRVGVAPATVRVTTDQGSTDVDVDPEASVLRIAVPRGPTSSLRLELLEVEDGGRGQGFGLAEVGIPGAEVRRPLSLPPGDADGGLVLSARSMERGGCAAAPTNVVCDPQLAAPGEERSGIDRWVDLPQGGSYEVAATVRPRPGSALDAYLAAPGGAVSVEASSQVSSDPAVRGQAAADQQDRTTWIASPLDDSPTLTVRLPQEQRIEGLQLQTAPDAPASRPLEVTVTANGIPQTVFADDEGVVPLAPVRTDEFTIEFGTVNPVRSLESETGATRLLPVGVTEFLIEGGPDRRMLQEPDDAVLIPCGFGPEVFVDGARAALTSVTATAGGIVDGRLADAPGCDGSIVDLPAGRHRIEVRPTAEWLVEDLVLTPTGQGPEATSVSAPEILQWTDTQRAVQVPAGSGPRMLETTENFNAGWEAELAGQRLEPYRVDGWRQAFLVPAGLQGTVELSYRPDAAYGRGLLVGLLAALGLLGLALVPAARPGPAPAGPGELPRAAVVVPALAALLIGGWIGALACGGAFVVAWAAGERGSAPRRRAAMGYGLVGLAVALGLQVLYPWPDRLSLGLAYDVVTIMGPAMALGALAVLGRSAGAHAAGSAARGSAS